MAIATPPRQQHTTGTLWFVAGIALVIAAFGIVYSLAHTGAGPTVNVFAPIPITVPNRAIAAELPAGDVKAFKVISDLSVFDLQYWKPVPPDEVNTRWSPALYSNVLRIRKVAPGRWFSAHYATSGSAIDLRCISHPARAFDKPKSKVHETDAEYEYGMLVDLGDLPVGREAEVVIQGIYWNGFSDEHGESASTYTDTDYDEAEDLELLVVAPGKKPLKSIELLASVGDSPAKISFRGKRELEVGPKGSFARWSIHNLEPSEHYTMRWGW